ncbi:sperm antigen with calponin homology and coiled-coil domains split discs isoform X6 [Choristoneura fumiferana]|uniref:sperm antigen with calponin homology and coiled-coil domains split discs isoform X6 n=1 Tax=Choristoneura fumiferana TaxID=7141 RepID=UPI003D159C42
MGVLVRRKSKIEEVMQQKAPGVPSNSGIHYPQRSSSAAVTRKGFSANFFKTTFSSRVKAVPTAGSSYSVEETTKIGSAETKPVTRNRPRTVPPTESTLKKSVLRSKSSKRVDKPTEPERSISRTSQLTPDPGGVKKQHDLKSPNVVLQIVKRSHAPAKPLPKTPDKTETILPPSLKPKVPEKTKSKTRTINNNNVWNNANDAKIIGKKLSVQPIRGPSQGKQEPALKGAPSVSSLDSKHHKVAPTRDKSLKIFGSKEKLHKAHKKKELGNNNAVLEDQEGEFEDAQGQFESAEELSVRGSQECVSLPVMLNAEHHMPGFQEVELRPRLPSEASLASGARELESLRRELEASAMERAQLQTKVDELLERASEAERLRAELDRLKLVESEREAALERLADENGALRARLRGVAHSPLSDSEKRQLLLAPAPRRMHSSAPASIALAHNGEGDSGDASTPEWDKHSSSSLSEVSVACLQDRILQMEEHHYSTSEELQATLAELADLQTQLADAHADNERLADEKQVLLESLCRQTEKLEDSRTKVDTLQEMLLREGVEPETLLSGDTDQQLLAVLKVSQEERRLLISKQEQLEADIAQAKTSLEEKTKETDTLTERVRTLESTLERCEAERLQWEHEAGASRELAAARQHQLTTLGELLDQAKAKLAERAGAADSCVEAEAAAAAARREAEAAAARAHALHDRLAHAMRQLDRAHSDARKLHDDALVSRNNAKSTISELEFQLEQLRQEKAALQAELQSAHDAANELQIQLQVAQDEKLSLMSRAGEALAHAADTERQLSDARARAAQLTRDRERDEAEWKQFQSDLLMTVRVANDFKTEAQRELERLVSENKAARDRIRLLEDQIHSLKAMPPRTEEPPPPPPLLTSASLQDIMATAASHRRTKGVSRQDSRLSVKSLIESIENAAKAAKQSPATTPVTEWPQVSPPPAASPAAPAKNGLSDPAPAQTNGVSNNFTKPPAPRSARASPIAAEGAPGANIPDEQRALSLQQKAIESFVRRNSYGDICERKDPLNALQVKNGGSKRNALLKWCQQKTMGYNNIDITNFSSSWNDGMALCALLHSYLGDARVPYAKLSPHDQRTNFSVACAAAEAVGIPTTLNIQDMIQQERPDWQQVMAYVTSIYKHFET